MTRPYIIAITGTKGKTTVARLLSHVLAQSGHTTLRVDTDGHYVNEKQRSSAADSRSLYGLLPATSPGRYLYELKGKPNAIAVLEVSFSSSGTAGLGYLSHDVGIFTNVYQDHIGRGIKSRAELATRKARLVFGRLRPGGTAIFNADDVLATKGLSEVPSELAVTYLPIGLMFSAFDITKHLAAGGKAITKRGHEIGILSARSFKPLLAIEDIPWTFGGFYEPSVYALLCAIAALLAANNHRSVPPVQLAVLKKYRLPENGGRLTMLENESGVRALLDFAHEKKSLRQVARLARRLSRGSTIGVIRLNPDRTDKLIQETGRYIANDFDAIIVYDKIDNIRRAGLIVQRWNLTRRPGETAELLFRSIKDKQKSGHSVQKIIQEEKAVAAACAKARSGDVIVHIVNDDHETSLNFVKHHLAK